MRARGRHSRLILSLASTIHIVFSTKGRTNLIAENKFQELFAYVIGTARNIGIPLLAIGEMPNPRSYSDWFTVHDDVLRCDFENQSQFLLIL